MKIHFPPDNQTLEMLRQHALSDEYRITEIELTAHDCYRLSFHLSRMVEFGTENMRLFNIPVTWVTTADQ